MAAPASASSVAYIDDHNLWFSSPDGARQGPGDHRAAPTTRPGSFPSQGRDGKTVVVHRDTFEGGSKRPVLYLYGPERQARHRQRDAASTPARRAPVYPIGLDMDWNSNAVAYGYQYCGFACQSLYRGFWLTFSDNQGAYPERPAGRSRTRSTRPSTRRASSSADSGGNIFVQPDVAEAPFTSSYQGWITHGDGYYLSRAEVSPANDQVAIDWIKDDGAHGITVAQHSGTVPSDLVAACDLPAVGKACVRHVLARRVADGLDRRRGREGRGRAEPGRRHRHLHPDRSRPRHLAPPAACRASAALTSAPVAGARRRRGRRSARAAAPARPRRPARRRRSTVRLSGKAIRAAFAKGLTIKVGARRPGASTPPPRSPRRSPRKLRLSGGASAARIATRGFAAASTVTVARGHAKAKRAGTVKLRLKPTKAAKRAAKRMRKVVLTIKVSQPGAAGKATVRLK